MQQQQTNGANPNLCSSSSSGSEEQIDSGSNKPNGLPANQRSKFNSNNTNNFRQQNQQQLNSNGNHIDSPKAIKK